MQLKKQDIIVLCILFIAAFWLWTLPFQENPLPFSEHDGAYIFSYGDHITFLGRTMDLEGDVPPSIVHWYEDYNKIFGPWGIVYPPPYNIDYSLMQIIGGERIIPVFIFIAFGSFLGVFSMYFLMRKLFGFLPAVITSSAMLFSFREILTYLWGQRHNLLSFVFIPITIYAFYQVLSSYYKNDKKQYISYLYVFVILFGSSAMLHLTATIFLVVYCFVLLLFFLVKYRKIPFDKALLKHYSVIVFLFFALTVVMYPIYYSAVGVTTPTSYKNDFSSLLKWINIPENNFTLNPVYIFYNSVYISKWTLFLLFLGILLLFLTKGDKKWILFSGIITLYLLYHMHVFGLVEIGSYRVGRYMIMETYFFYAIMAVGIVNLPHFFPIDKKIKTYAKYALSGSFIVILIFTQGAKAYDTLKNSYSDVMRVTPAQYEIASWIENNVPENNGVNILGTLTYPKLRWIQVLSRRFFLQNYEEEYMVKWERITRVKGWPDIVSPVEHIVFDYSDLVAIGDKQKIADLQQKEQLVSKNAKLVYDKNFIRVYKFD